MVMARLKEEVMCLVPAGCRSRSLLTTASTVLTRHRPRHYKTYYLNIPRQLFARNSKAVNEALTLQVHSPTQLLANPRSRRHCELEGDALPEQSNFR